MGTPSQAQRRYNPPPNRSRPIYKNRYNPNLWQTPYYPVYRDPHDQIQEFRGHLGEHR